LLRLRTRKSLEDELWALLDVSFDVDPGEVIGIVGRNGAGKSTLLKILARITKPSAGEIDIYGRVGSLLEIGTGFHPDLTGRENIYLNATILGMKRPEIKRKFDEIVAFSEVEQFLEMPVKFYSTGMYLRLAFAVAAHVESDVLLLDEVLAVGDLAFQKKCRAKMREVSSEGRTVFFVSHSMAAIQDLCTRVLLVSAGRLIETEAKETSIAKYLEDDSDRQTENTQQDTKERQVGSTSTGLRSQRHPNRGTRGSNRKGKCFSIITPTLNPGPKLEETINSVLAQKKDLFEYIIIDGGSTDDTLSIIKRYSGQIHSLSESDDGVYEAMNKGIEMASGDYLYFLGAGDLLRKDVLEKIGKMIPDRHTIFLYGNAYHVAEKRELGGRFHEARIARTNICHQAIFYERCVFHVMGKYDLKYNVLADHAFNIKCFGEERIEKLYVDEVIADYEGDGLSVRERDLNFIKDMHRIIRENLGLKRYLLNRLINAYYKVFHFRVQLLIDGARKVERSLLS